MTYLICCLYDGLHFLTFLFNLSWNIDGTTEECTKIYLIWKYGGIVDNTTTFPGHFVVCLGFFPSVLHLVPTHWPPSGCSASSLGPLHRTSVPLLWVFAPLRLLHHLKFLIRLFCSDRQCIINTYSRIKQMNSNVKYQSSIHMELTFTANANTPSNQYWEMGCSLSSTHHVSFIQWRWCFKAMKKTAPYSHTVYEQMHRCSRNLWEVHKMNRVIPVVMGCWVGANLLSTWACS